MKYINFKRYKFLTIFRKVNLKQYNFARIYKYIGIRRYNFSKIYKYFDIGNYNFIKIYKYFNFKKIKHLIIYSFIGCISAAFIYLVIPMFYSFEKTKFENIICKDFNIKCTIQGKIKYSFFPTPRIKLDNLKIKNLGQIENVDLKLSIFNLYKKEKLGFKKLELDNASINLDIEKFDKYKNFFNKKNNLKPINLKNGKIKFYENKNYIAAIENIKFKYRSNQKEQESILKGNFLNDELYIKLIKNENAFIILTKFLKSNIYTKINVYDFKEKNKILNGNILLKKNKNKLIGDFVYDVSKKNIVFKESNLTNVFLEGKLGGKIDFLPYFKFNLDVDLKGFNFTKFHGFLLALDKEKRKGLFKVSNKINGQLNLSTNKLYSKYNLIKSFESQIVFKNGNILVNQLLLNLGKLGAADVTGIIKNEKKFSNFSFENNIFIDNQKYFYSKFGVYNKKDVSSNLFISGNFDLVNWNMRFHEISTDEKLKKADLEYIEKEFNDVILEDDYKTFFNFPILKDFVKLIISESN